MTTDKDSRSTDTNAAREDQGSLFAADIPSFHCDDSAVELQAPQTGLYRDRRLQPESDEVIQKALDTDAVARRILAKNQLVLPGMKVGIRLNLNVIKTTGVAVHTVHRATSKDGHRHGRGFYRGEVISYQPVVVLVDCYFNVHQAGREGIASGRSTKHPMASADGTYCMLPQVVDFSGVAVSFNPRRTHLFLDEEGYAIKFAQHVTILGHRAYARGVLRYFTQAGAPLKVGHAPSCAKFRQV